MAEDVRLLEAVGHGAPPVLRFYAWSRPTVSLGYAQDAATAVDAPAAQRLGVDQVRRPTGGRAVVHDDELTYSVVLPAAMVPADVRASYALLAEGLVAGLRAVGVAARCHDGAELPGHSALCFVAPSWHEITLDGRKLVGSAQCRRAGAVLQHGSIPFAWRPGRWWAALRHPPGETPQTFLDRAASLGRPGTPELIRTLADEIQAALGRVLDVEFTGSTLAPSEVWIHGAS